MKEKELEAKEACVHVTPPPSSGRMLIGRSVPVMDATADSAAQSHSDWFTHC